MTAATAPGAARGRAREGASRRKELEDDHYGLGLHAASEAASAHGGSVSLANSPSGGAVATIAVPLCGA